MSLCTRHRRPVCQSCGQKLPKFTTVCYCGAVMK